MLGMFFTNTFLAECRAASYGLVAHNVRIFFPTRGIAFLPAVNGLLNSLSGIVFSGSPYLPDPPYH